MHTNLRDFVDNKELNIKSLKLMKRVLILFALTSIVGFTSCAKKRYTCPTYMKDTRQQKDIKVKNTLDQKNKTSKLVKSRG